MEGIREKFLWRKAFLSKVVGYACHFKKKKSLYQHFSRISRILKIRKATFFFFFKYGCYFMHLPIHAELEQLNSLINLSDYSLTDHVPQ